MRWISWLSWILPPCTGFMLDGCQSPKAAADTHTLSGGITDGAFFIFHVDRNLFMLCVRCVKK